MAEKSRPKNGDGVIIVADKKDTMLGEKIECDIIGSTYDPFVRTCG
ncbi:MAG: hypothetical protein AABZ39_04815 [Spirochaetota bacterium]